MIYEIYIKNNEYDDTCLAIGVKINGKEFALSCNRDLKGVSGGIDAALNSLKLIVTFGEKALKDGDIDSEFIFQQKDYDQDKVNIDYKVVLK